MGKIKHVFKVIALGVFLYLVYRTLMEVSEPLSLVLEKSWWIIMVAYLYYDLKGEKTNEHSQ